MQQASCLEGGPLLWIWPLYLHVNQKSDDDDDDDVLPVLSAKRVKKNCSECKSVNTVSFFALHGHAASEEWCASIRDNMALPWHIYSGVV